MTARGRAAAVPRRATASPRRAGCAGRRAGHLGWPAALLLCALAGCKLIDQTTFDPLAGLPPAIAALPAEPAAAAPEGPPALLRVPLDPEPDWRAALREAVAAARRIKTDVQFDVVAAVPAPEGGGAGGAAGQGGSPGGLDAAVQMAGDPAGRIASAIRAQGVPAGRVRLLARPEAGLAAPEVRVFVR